MQQVTTKEHQVQQMTTKDPKKVEVGKRLAEYNPKKRKEQKIEVNQYYNIGVVLAVGAIGCLGYYLYQNKKGESLPPQPQPPQLPKANKFKME